MPEGEQDLERSAVTAALREAISASHELTARLSRSMGINASDSQALYLLGAHGPMGSAEIAHRLSMTPASVTALTDRLQRRGYVVKNKDERDGRRVQTETTSRAQVDSAGTWLPAIRALDAVAEQFSAADHEIIGRYLRAAAHAMRAQPDVGSNQVTFDQRPLVGGQTAHGRRTCGLRRLGAGSQRGGSPRAATPELADRGEGRWRRI